MDVLARIDDARRECNVLEHPFYQRWSAGELSAEDLGFYAGEYRHAVVALAEASDSAAAKVSPESRAGLERHASEERSHIVLWDEFAAAAAGEDASQRKPLDETDRCTRARTAAADALARAAVPDAVETSAPAVAERRLCRL